jgi:hypothetical protein
MDKHYYICEFRLDGKISYVIWYSGEQDGILMRQENVVIALNSLEYILAYTQEKSISVVDESIPVYDFNFISSWCIQPSPAQIDCKEFLNIWNMFTDLASSIGNHSQFCTADVGINNLYDKLFYGNNLPSSNLTQKLYKPSWSQDEADAIANLFVKGLKDLRSVMPVVVGWALPTD